jgi:hypothetical protein
MDRQTVSTEMCRKLMATDKRDNKKAVHSSHASLLKTKEINQRSYLPETKRRIYRRKGLRDSILPNKLT